MCVCTHTPANGYNNVNYILSQIRNCSYSSNYSTSKMHILFPTQYYDPRTVFDKFFSLPGSLFSNNTKYTCSTLVSSFYISVPKLRPFTELLIIQSHASRITGRVKNHSSFAFQQIPVLSSVCMQILLMLMEAMHVHSAWNISLNHTLICSYITLALVQMMHVPQIHSVCLLFLF